MEDNWLIQQANAVRQEYENMDPVVRQVIETESQSRANKLEEDNGS